MPVKIYWQGNIPTFISNIMKAGLSAVAQKVETTLYTSIEDKSTESIIQDASGAISFTEKFALTSNIRDQLI